MNTGEWTRRLRRQRALLTCVDYTRGQSAKELAERLCINPATAHKHLLDLEKRGAVVVRPGRPLLWYRASVH